MAIKCNLTIKGVSLPEAYVRINRIFGGKDDEKWTARYDVHANDSKDGALETDNIEAPYVAGQNPYETVYEAMKVAQVRVGTEEIPEDEREEGGPTERVVMAPRFPNAVDA